MNDSALLEMCNVRILRRLEEGDRVVLIVPNGTHMPRERADEFKAMAEEFFGVGVILCGGIEDVAVLRGANG